MHYLVFLVSSFCRGRERFLLYNNNVLDTMLSRCRRLVCEFPCHTNLLFFHKYEVSDMYLAILFVNVKLSTRKCIHNTQSCFVSFSEMVNFNSLYAG